MARGRKTGGRNFVKGDPRAGRPKGSRDRVPRTLKGSLKAVLEEIAQVEEPLIYARLVGLLKGRQFLAVMQFLAHYTIDKTVKLQPDLSKLTVAELEALRTIVARTQSS